VLSEKWAKKRVAKILVLSNVCRLDIDWLSFPFDPCYLQRRDVACYLFKRPF